MSERPVTPLRLQASGISKAPLTPEQLRRMEEGRLKAKALRAQSEAASRAAGHADTTRTPSGFIAGQKRPHASLNTSSASGFSQSDARRSESAAALLPNASATTRKPHDDIQAARKFTKYVEYDFSKMTDTKGGFLTAEDDPHNRALHTPNQEEKPAHMSMREWERHQLLKKLREQKAGPFEPGLSVLKREAGGETVGCRECSSLEVDWRWEEVFGIRVCNTCKEKLPERYSLLTKTEAREDYLLTDPELKDAELLPHLERPNPHKATWNNMQLYLRFQVEDYAFSEKRWGSGQKLDEEFERREKEKKKRKEDKFKMKLLELKKRTRVDAYKRGKGGGPGGGEFGDKIERRGDRHEHEWGRTLENADGIGVKKCIDCGMEVEELEF